MPKEMSKILPGIKVVLLDIEGTICSVSFVKDTLFPYALRALPAVLQDRWTDPVFQQYRDQFPEDARANPQVLDAYVRDLTERDVKVAYLKNLQGYLWQTGYEEKAYATPLFPDVVRRLKKWQEEGKSLAIFSSGSVFAQKLLFGHVKKDPASTSNDSDDLTGLISAWYDTTNAGPKTEARSYHSIAHGLGSPPEEILFLSDNVKEVDAAKEAKMKAILVDRPGNAAISENDRSSHIVVNSLDEISFE